MRVAKQPQVNVFSAHAEVVPRRVCLHMQRQCILRARGGSSIIAQVGNIQIRYSPRTRR